MAKKIIIRQKDTLFSLDNLLQGLGTAVLKSIRDPFAIISKDYHILWLNRAMMFVHGNERNDADIRKNYPKDAVGKICYDYFSQGDTPCEVCPLRTVFKTGRSNVSERYLDIPGGDRRWGEVKAYPIRGAGRTVEAAYVLIFDITHLKKSIDSQKQYARSLSRQLNARTEKSQTVYLDGSEIAIQTRLTHREKEILRLITEGYTNTQVSDALGISPHTVKTHVIHIFNKLGVSDRTQAAVMAIRYNLI